MSAPSHDKTDAMVEAAVRPIAGNLEIQQAARQFLRENLRPDDDEALERLTARWIAVDAKKANKARWSLSWAFIVLFSAGVLIPGVIEIIAYTQHALYGSDPVIQPPPANAAIRVAEGLDGTQKLLLVGDSPATTPLESSEALWLSDPDNPAFFAEYAASYVSANDSLPPDYRNTVHRIDPENAYFIYLEAAVEGKNSVSGTPVATSKPGSLPPDLSWQVLDQAKLDRCMELMREARGKNKFNSYAAEMLAARTASMEQKKLLDQFDLTTILATKPSVPWGGFFPVLAPILTQSSIFAATGETAAFEDLEKTSEQLFLAIFKDEPCILITEVISEGMANNIGKNLSGGRATLGLPVEDDKWGRLHQLISEGRERRKGSQFLIDGKLSDIRNATSVFSMPMLSSMKVVVTLPPLPDSQLQPGRLGDHEMASRAMAMISWLLMSGSLSLAFLHRFRAKTVAHRLGKMPGAPYTLSKPGRTDLTEKERLILYGDESESTNTGRWKGLWDRHPENAAYFAQYAVYHLADHGRLPDDFLVTAKRVDPDNAWFLYLASSVEAKDAVQKVSRSTPPEWTILDEPKMERSLALLHDARSLKSFENYKALLIREKIPLLDQSDYYRYLLSFGYIAGSPEMDTMGIRRLADVISAKAALLAHAKDGKEFRDLLADSEAMLHKLHSMPSGSLVFSLVSWVNASSSAQGLAAAAMELGMTEEAERLQDIHDRSKNRRDAMKKRELLVDGVEVSRKTAFLPGQFIPMTSRQSLQTVPITYEELKPGRLMEHELASLIGSVFIYSFLLPGLITVWAYRLRQRRLIRQLAKRMESILTPTDWFWIGGIGVVAPMIWMQSLYRLTPLGCRDLSVSGMQFILPQAHYFALLVLFLILPVLVIRWRLGKKAAAFGFSTKRSWFGWTAVISTIAFMVTIALALKLGGKIYPVISFAFLLVPLLWLLITAGRALFAGSSRLMAAGTSARILVPIYAGAALLMVCLIPVHYLSIKEWYKRDTFSKLTPEFPGVMSYEYKVAMQSQKELRELLGIDR